MFWIEKVRINPDETFYIVDDAEDMIDLIEKEFKRRTRLKSNRKNSGFRYYKDGLPVYAMALKNKNGHQYIEVDLKSSFISELEMTLKSEHKKLARKYIADQYDEYETKSCDNRLDSINAITKGKITSNRLTELKIHVIPELKTAIQIATNARQDELTKPRKDFNCFILYDVLFEINNQMYNVTLRVGVKSDSRGVLHEITNLVAA